MNNKGNYKQILNYYESKPKGKGPFRTVILLVHAPGIDDSSKKICDDLALAGFYAVAPDPYLNGVYDFKSKSDDIIFDGLKLMLAVLRKNSIVDMSRLGIIGFCMGGRHTYLANVYHDIFKAAVPYYGFPQVGGTSDSIPQNRVEEFNAPVLSIFGTEDTGIPMEFVQKYKEVSEINGKHKSIIYEGAAHGFLNHNSRNHHPQAAEDAWNKTIEFFNELL